MIYLINTHFLFLAAGRGSRLQELTRFQPKGLVKIGNKSLVEFSIQKILKLGFSINDITIITGYLAEKYQDIHCRNIYNESWETTNSFYSLLTADSILSSHPTIVIYSDIFFHVKVLQELIKSKEILTMPSYNNWRNYWVERFEDPLTDLETFKVDKFNNLREISLKPQSFNDIDGQYMGIFAITPAAWLIIKNALMTDQRFALKRLDITSAINLALQQKTLKIKVLNMPYEWFELDNERDFKILINRFS